MNFEECAAKPLLANQGIKIPRGFVVTAAGEAGSAAESLGTVVIKAQVPTGKRGKAGGIKLAQTPAEAIELAGAILGMEIGGHRVEKLLVEERADIEREFYASVINNAASKGPMVMFSTEGGMDIEEVAARSPDRLKKHEVDIRRGFHRSDAEALIEGLDVSGANPEVAEVLVKLYQTYITEDAELMEINPLIVTGTGEVVALDCKYVMDDSAIKRHEDLARQGAPEKLTALEARGQDLGIKYIELDGDVGVLANGAGLTMTTMDVIRHHGGAPANFCEIGGEAYTKAKPALELVLAKPGIKALVVNFCGAFARCDVMMEGLLGAWQEMALDFPVFFSIAGTGDEAAIRMLEKTLGMDPLPDMSAACKAAVAAAAAAHP